ncbi:DUF4012 domain-containing protein [Patescibacteria group bacterium]|nr:DUF4012 domain-containing protein [Patescibacteria group bacterium]
MSKMILFLRKLAANKRFRCVLAISAGITICFYLLILRPGIQLANDAQATIALAREFKTAVKDQSLNKIAAKAQEIQFSLTTLEEDFNRFRFINYFPYLKLYYQDGQHLLEAGKLGIEATQIIIEELKPFASLLGLEEETNQMLAQEKIAHLASIAPSLLPAVENAQEKLSLVLNETAQLHPSIYPQEIRGYKIRNQLVSLQSQISNLQQQINDLKPLLNEIPSLLGVHTPQNYLILFQNDKELRPTGGFITAYAIAQLDQGNFSIIASDDIYNLDQDIVYLDTPYPITAYLKVKGLFMRDTNFSPDFKESMTDFEYYYDRTGSIPVMGIIALDTQFVEHFLELSGPVSVPGYELNFSGYWNLPEACKTGGLHFTTENVICRLELYAEKIFDQRENRKAILGELMAQLVDWALTAQADQWPELITLVFDQLREKHLLLYLHNQEAQTLIEKYNYAGEIHNTNGDFLHINQANLAGLKSDMYMVQKVKQEISITDNNEVTTKLTLSYHNTGTYDGWLNSTARNYIRVYVPQGSTLLSWSGGEYSQPNTFDDLGKTVFDNFLLTKPLSESVLTFEYKSPFKFEMGKGFDTKEYNLLIQKQPGLNAPEYEVCFERQCKKFELATDKEIMFDF